MNLNCESCPHRSEFVRYGIGSRPGFTAQECKAGSLPPNPNADIQVGKYHDTTGIYVISLDMQLFDQVKEYGKTSEGITGSSFNAEDTADCRKRMRVDFLQNQKGLAAKVQFLRDFFPDHSEVKKLQTLSEYATNTGAKITDTDLKKYGERLIEAVNLGNGSVLLAGGRSIKYL